MKSRPNYPRKLNLGDSKVVYLALHRGVNDKKYQELSKLQHELEDVRFAGVSNLLKTFSVHTTAGIILLIVSLTSAYTIVYEHAQEEDKSWARTTLTSMGTGVIGFLFGQKELENSKTRSQESEDQS